MKEIDTLYRKYAPMIFRRCLSILRNEDLARDALQDVFEAYIKRGPGLPVINKGAFLYKMAQHRSLRILSKEPLDEDKDCLIDLTPASGDLENSVTEKIMKETLMERLERKNRLIVDLVFIKKMKRKEAAEVLGISDRTIRIRLEKIRKMARLLQEEVK